MAHIITEGHPTYPPLPWWFTQSCTCAQCGCVFRPTSDDIANGGWVFDTANPPQYILGQCPFCAYLYMAIVAPGSSAATDRGFITASILWGWAVTNGMISVKLVVTNTGLVVAVALNAQYQPFLADASLGSLNGVPWGIGYWSIVHVKVNTLLLFRVSGTVYYATFPAGGFAPGFQLRPQTATQPILSGDARKIDPSLINFLSLNQIPITEAVNGVVTDTIPAYI